jgi:hypothetical protein
MEEIGYEMAGWMKVYYCISMLTTYRNGSREIRDNEDTKFMITLVDIGQHFFSVYLEHEHSMSYRRWDDVVQYHVASLSTVISPCKPSERKKCS